HAKQCVAAHAAEAVPGGRDPLAAIMDLDIVPVHEVATECAVCLRIRVRDSGHRRIGEDDAEPERLVAWIALDHADLVAWVGLLHQHGEIQPAGPAADADDPHYRNFGGRFATKASYASRKSGRVINRACCSASNASAVRRSIV